MNPHSNVTGPFATSRGRLEHPMPSAPLGPTAVRVAEDRTLSHGEPSKPVLGALPIARWIPMDVHSMMDYGNAALIAGLATQTRLPEARTASLVLGAAVGSVSLITDYRLSLAKLIPIEVHEVIDHLWGIAAIAAPFVFGYWKRAPKVSLVHVLAGASTIVASLVTDYRAVKRRTTWSQAAAG